MIIIYFNKHQIKNFRISYLCPETPCFDALESQIRAISLSVIVLTTLPLTVVNVAHVTLQLENFAHS
jgi:hypothetical protein